MSLSTSSYWAVFRNIVRYWVIYWCAGWCSGGSGKYFFGGAGEKGYPRVIGGIVICWWIRDGYFRVVCGVLML